MTINGRAATLGQRVSLADAILVNGRPVRLGAKTDLPRVLLYHKPSGEIVSRSDPRGRPTVFERLPEVRDARWVAVGRLDFNTSGLLLFTDSGELAHRLMHPSFGLLREYAVRVLGALSEAAERRLTQGVQLEDGSGRLESLIEAGGEGSNRWYTVTLREGRNREVRRLFSAVGLTVSRLIRVGYGDVRLPRQLRQGHLREMAPEDVERLLQTTEAFAPAAPAALF